MLTESKELKRKIDWSNTPTLSGIRSFGVSTTGKLHLIFDERPATKGRLNTWYSSDIGSYIYYKNDVVKDVVLSQEEPIFVDVNSKLIGHGNICVNQVSAALDKSLWALGCDLIDADGNRQLLRWDQSA